MLESTSLQGGTVIVHTPTKSENLTILDPPMKSTQPIKTMQTRSSNRIRTPTAIVQPQMIKKHATVKRTPQKCRPGVKANHDESDLSPDEIERLRIRRERNKAAAARCRKRRMDTISTLELELQQHQSECKFTNENLNSFNTFAVKSEPVIVEPMYVLEPTVNPVVEVPANAPTKLKPKRPLTLTISQPTSVKTTSATGIDIETPSNVLISMGFDNLMTSTGLTPTSNIITPISFPSCSSQQRTSEGLNDLSTPSTENLSLVSL